LMVLPKLDEMINSHKTTFIKRRKRAAELIGLFAKVKLLRIKFYRT